MRPPCSPTSGSAVAADAPDGVVEHGDDLNGRVNDMQHNDELEDGVTATRVGVTDVEDSEDGDWDAHIVLSEVHTDTVSPLEVDGRVVSRFVAWLPEHESEDEEVASHDGESDGEDADGDAVVRRRKRRVVQLTVPHAMATPIAAVGLQVWAGALLLGDFLAHQVRCGGLPRTSSGRLVGLELGGGTGFASVAAVAIGGFDVVFCTDVRAAGL
jgi:hypothetical protein